MTTAATLPAAGRKTRQSQGYLPISESPFFTYTGPLVDNYESPSPYGSLSPSKTSAELIPHVHLLSPIHNTGSRPLLNNFELYHQNSIGSPYNSEQESNNYPCPRGLARRADGECVVPIVSKNVYLFNAPKPPKRVVYPAKNIPHPKIHYNYVFLKAPDALQRAKPVVIPPPRQKTLIYLLTKRNHGGIRQVIEIPSVPAEPEVYFVTYKDGENLDLPGGIDLHTALSQSSKSPLAFGEEGLHNGAYNSIDGGSNGIFDSDSIRDLSINDYEGRSQFSDYSVGNINSFHDGNNLSLESGPIVTSFSNSGSPILNTSEQYV